MRPLLFLLCLSSAFLLSCQPAASQDKKSKEALAAKADAPGDVVNEVLPPEAYKARMKELGADVQLVDVRRPNEYREGHIEGALNIDFLEEDFARQMERQLDKNKPVMLYCRSGRRSAQAAEQLKALGFKQVYDLEGGFLEWK